jgi:hypothetical protein
MKTDCIQFELGIQDSRKRHVEVIRDMPDSSSDGGLLLLAEIECRRGFLQAFSRCFIDHRRVDLITHPLKSLLAQRIYGLCQGYEDLNDHDLWRSDPLLGIVCGREGDDDPLAGKSTLNRLELGGGVSSETDRYKRIEWDEGKIREFFVDAFLESYIAEPDEIVIDFDATDDPVHGEQEGRFFHGFYDEYCFLPLYAFCEHHLLAAILRPADQDGAAGVVELMEFLHQRIRARWPHTRIIVRGDSGFCREPLMVFCETHPMTFYVLGLARNRRLQRAIGKELNDAAALYAQSGHAARVFKELRYSTKKTWVCERRVVAKAEHLAKGSNPRFVVTNLDPATWPARELYERFYCARGEMENRIKEQQLFLFADRTSSHMFRANQLRLWLSSLAYLFLCELRRVGLAGTDHDRAQCSTIRIHLLKVAATVVVSTRRILVRLPRSFPFWELWRSAISALSTT